MMNNDKSYRDESDGDERFDELADRMRREAIDERPEFSAELHRRIVSRVRAERIEGKRLRISLLRWAPIAAAVAACVIAAIWIHYEQPALRPAPPGEIAINVPGLSVAQPAATPGDASLAIDFSGLLSANLSPSGITLSFPRIVAASDESDSQPGSQQSLFAAMANVMPPDVRDMLELPQAQ
jgi:hypothetical protein